MEAVNYDILLLCLGVWTIVLFCLLLNISVSLPLAILTIEENVYTIKKN